MNTPPAFLTENVSLAPLSGYKTGGTAKYFLETADLDTLQQALLWSKNAGVHVFFLGSGTNLLFPDGRLNRLVIRWSQKGIEINAANQLVIGAGEELQTVVRYALDHGIKDFSWAAGLPGTMGAAVRGNVGAFGQDMSDIFVKAQYLDIDEPMQVRSYNKDEMNFAYRSSAVKEQGLFVLQSWLKIARGSEAEMEKEHEKAAQHLEFRNSRHPLTFPNSGSVFKNINDPAIVEQLLDRWPEWKPMVLNRWHGKIPAAAIIDAVNLKDLRIGNAAISSQHANFIINCGNATSDDIYCLIRRVQHDVFKQFGVTLEPEIQILINQD